MTDAERQTLLDEALASPASSTVDGTTIQNRSLAEMQDFTQRERANAGAAKNHRGVRFGKMIPPGTTGQ